MQQIDQINLTHDYNRDYSRTKYIAIATYHYSGGNLGELEEASVYIVNPYRRGNGPGEIQLLTSCGITGTGCNKCMF